MNKLYKEYKTYFENLETGFHQYDLRDADEREPFMEHLETSRKILPRIRKILGNKVWTQKHYNLLDKFFGLQFNNGSYACPLKKYKKMAHPHRLLRKFEFFRNPTCTDYENFLTKNFRIIDPGKLILYHSCNCYTDETGGIKVAMSFKISTNKEVWQLVIPCVNFTKDYLAGVSDEEE